MKIGSTCTVCNARIEDDAIVHCNTCGRDVHEQCETYETTYECRYCGEEPWIGAVEF